MIKLDLKPLSVNALWRGKRFKTPSYSAYERQVFYLLPNDLPVKIDKTKPFILILHVGIPKLQDLSNTIKAFEDVLQKKYDFNDNMIYEINAKKFTVKKGQEFIKFHLINL